MSLLAIRRFSLLEILSLLVPLLVVAAAATGIRYHASDEQTAKLTRARDDLRVLNMALLRSESMPTGEQGLAELVRQGAIGHVPTDPWGRPYQYLNPGKVTAFDLYSLGQDGRESTDDVVAWNLYGGRAE